MKNLHIQNLEMIITKKCNLKCAHCMRGAASNKDMSEEVINATLQQIKSVGNLAISGGEPLLALDTLEKIFTYVIDNKIFLDEYSLVTNCAKDPKELIRLFDYFEAYVKQTSRNPKENKGLIAISIDNYHYQELSKLDKTSQDEILQYMKDLSKTPYFYSFKTINKKLFAAGNAVNLPKKDTVVLRPMQTYICYANETPKFIDRFKPIPQTGICNIGPMICINPEGIITEDGASYLDQETIYNYGNVKEISIEQACLNHGAKVIRPNNWFRKTGKEIKKYRNYNK